MITYACHVVCLCTHYLQIYVETQLKGAVSTVHAQPTMAYVIHRVAPPTFVFFAISHIVLQDNRAGLLITDILYDFTTAGTYMVLFSYAYMLV